MAMRGLQVRVPVYILLGGAVICLFDFLNSRHMLHDDLVRRTVRSFAATSDGAARFISGLDPGGTRGTADAALAQMVQLRLADRAAVVAADGRVLAQHDAGHAEAARVRSDDATATARARLAPGATRADRHATDLVAAVAPLPGGWRGEPAWVLMQCDLGPNLARIDGLLLREFAMNGLLVLAVSLMMLLMLRSRLLRPAERLAAVADAFAAGDRTARTGITGEDEVFRAARAFDRMADRVVEQERAIAAEQAKFIEVIEKLPVGVVLVDARERRLIIGNARWREMFGIAAAPGADLAPYIQDWKVERLDGSPMTHAEMATPQVLRTGQPVTVSDIVYVRPDGQRVPHVVHAVPVSFGGGDRFDAVAVVTLDRRELVHLLDELRAWERRFERVAAATGQLVFEWDLVQGTIRRSGSSLQVLGYALGEAAEPALVAWHERIHPDDRERVQRRLDHCIATGEPFAEEYRFRHGRGHWIVIRDQGFLDREDGRSVRMYGTMSDVTARHALEEQLRQAQKMETVGTLAGGIAHDFNNQLTGVIGHLDLASDTLGPDDPRLVHIQVARRAAMRCAELTRGLLAFSRQLESHPRATDVAGLVTESVELLTRMLPASIRIGTRLAEGLPPAMVDPVQVQQVLFNLCINARDAMPAGGELEIGLASVAVDEPARRHADARRGLFLELRVRDHGGGISADVLPRIFEPFFTTKPVGEGTGLGLSMAYGIVRKHQGWIEVESSPTGTTFRVLLPATQCTDAVAAVAPAPDAAGGHGETVLVVDDEPVVRELALVSLRQAGFHAVGAADGEAAVAFVRDHPGTIAAVVLDMVMPGGGGEQVLPRLRALRPGLPVVLSSGYAPTTEGRLAGAAGWLPKPWGPSQLIEAVLAAQRGAIPA
jgi:PAS domain S-box-containing protein